VPTDPIWSGNLWLLIAAGLFLILLGLMCLWATNFRQLHRYSFGATLSRLAIGATLCLLATIKASRGSWNVFTWDYILLPVVAGAYLLTYAIDMLLAYVTNKDIRKTAFLYNSSGDLPRGQLPDSRGG